MTTSGLVRRVGHLGGGSAAGQAIAMLAAPVLARAYAPSDFGALAAFSSLALLLAAISSLRYEAGIPIAQSDGDALALLRLSLLLTVAASALVGAVAFAVRPWLPAAVLVGDVAWPLLLPLAILPLGLYQAYSGWAVRHKATALLGRTRVLQALAAVGSQLALVTSGGLGLVLGEVVGRVVGIGTLRRRIRRDAPLALTAAPGLGQVARRYRSLAAYLLPATLASAAAVHLPVVVVPALFGAAEGGSFYMVVRVGMAPALLIGTAIGQVLLGELGGSGDLTAARAQVGRMFTALVAIYLPGYAALAASAPFLASVVLGPEWAAAGTVARQLSPLLLTWSLASPLSVLLLIGRREGESLLVSALDLVGRLVAILVGWAMASFTLAMVAYGIVGGAVGVVSVIRCFRAVGAPLGPAVARTVPALVAALATGVFVAALTAAPLPPLLAVAGIVGGTVLAAVLTCAVTLRPSRSR